jgi:hypothetical protein
MERAPLLFLDWAGRNLSLRRGIIASDELETMTAQTLGLIGGALSAMGVALALASTAKVRSALRRLLDYLFPKSVQIVTGSAMGTVDAATLKARGRVGPGPDGWTDEEWHAELEKRIDQLAAEFDRHSHPDLATRLDRLSQADSETRDQVEAKLAVFTADTATSERWNIAGLAFALLGVVVQTIAVVAA